MGEVVVVVVVVEDAVGVGVEGGGEGEGLAGGYVGDDGVFDSEAVGAAGLGVDQEFFAGEESFEAGLEDGEAGVLGDFFFGVDGVGGVVGVLRKGAKEYVAVGV